MRKMWILMTAAIICAGLQTGCGGSDDETTVIAPPPNEPTAIVIAMLNSLASGDAETAVSYFICSTEDTEFLIRTMPLKHATMKLDKLGAEKYGLDDWREAKKPAGIESIVPDVTDLEDRVECTIVGNSAICQPEGFGGAIHLVKDNDKWAIIPTRGQFPPLQHRGDILKNIRAKSIAINSIIPKIAAGASARDICNQVKAAMKSQ